VAKHYMEFISKRGDEMKVVKATCTSKGVIVHKVVRNMIAKGCR
jgi:hypothetical protein